ncbi:MAG: helix-hairpin-helix domain-containing protein [Phycisphaerae bacterium]
MSTLPAPEPPPDELPEATADPAGWSQRQRIGLVLLLTVLAVVLTYQWWQREPYQGVTASAQTLEPLPQQIDPNTESVESLSRLPGIGTHWAQKIVNFREQQLQAGRQPPIFNRPDDLKAIPGLPGKAIDHAAYFMRFPDTTWQQTPTGLKLPATLPDATPRHQDQD